MPVCDNQTMGQFTRFLVEPGSPTYTFDSSSHIQEFIGMGESYHGRLLNSQGITGSLRQYGDRQREGTYYVRFPLAFYPSPYDLDAWLPHMTGGTFSTDTIEFDDSLPYFGMLVDYVTDVYLLSDCKINRWMLEGRAPRMGEQGEPDLIRLTLDIVGKTRTSGQSWPGTPPTLGTGADKLPYVMSDGAMTLSGTARTAYVNWFRLTCDYGLFVQHGMGTLGANAICPTRRDLTLQTQLSWNSTNESDLSIADEAGTAASLSFTNGNVSTTATITNVHQAGAMPAINKGPMWLNFKGKITGDASNTEISFDNDATP